MAIDDLTAWLAFEDPEAVDAEAVAAGRTIPMNTGAPPFPVNDVVRAAVKRRVDDPTCPGYPGVQGCLSYPDLRGTGSLRATVAAFCRGHLGLPYDETHVQITYGAMQAVYDALGAVATRAGRPIEVLVPTPYWFKFPGLIAQAGARQRDIDTEATGFRLTPQLLRDNLGPETGALMLTNPNNPSGTVYDRDDLAGLVAVLAEYPDVVVISDEVYNMLLFEDGEQPIVPSIGSFPEVADRVITVNSMSKNYAMSGLRVGYAATTGDDLLQHLRLRQELSTLGVNEYLQAGAEAAVTRSRPIVWDGILPQLRTRRRVGGELVRTQLPRLGYTEPASGYYQWVDVRDYLPSVTEQGVRIDTDTQLAAYLRDEAGVGVVPGTICGNAGYFRLTFAIPPDLFATGVVRMVEYLGKLKPAPSG